VELETPNPDDRARPRSTIDPRQAGIVGWRSSGPVPAWFFRDACRVMNDEIVLESPAKSGHRKSPVTRAFSVAGL